MNSLKKWRCITKETSLDKWDRYLDESEHLLTTTEVDYILTSKPAVDGKAVLVKADQADGIESLSIAQYCEVRDYLIVTLTRAVGTRPTALENATLIWSMAAILHDSVVVVRAHPRAIPLAMITMRKSIHGLPFLSYISMGLRLAALQAARPPLIINFPGKKISALHC